MEDLVYKNRPIVEEETPDNDVYNWLSTSFLPKQNCMFDQPLGAEIFKAHIKVCEGNLKRVLKALEEQKNDNVLNKKLIITIVLLCGEHSRSELWTSRQTLECAEQLLKLVLVTYSCKSVIDLLLYVKIDVIFTELRPKLLKNSWKDYPAAITCFVWLLTQIKCPHLGDALGYVLPPCLLLVDDHIDSNKIKGLQCLEHIANNVSRAELDQYDRGSVIYSALEHMVYLREPEIIPPLGSCLTALLSKTEHSLTSNNLAWSHFDDVLNVWLPSMEMEQKLLLREAYITSLVDLLHAMGLASVRWSKKLLNILSEYCDQDNTRDTAVLCLLTFMKRTWPRLSFNFERIVIILMKVVIKISKNSASECSSQSTLKTVKQCLALLDATCHEEYQSFLHNLGNCSELKDCLVLIADKNVGLEAK